MIYHLLLIILFTFSQQSVGEVHIYSRQKNYSKITTLPKFNFNINIIVEPSLSIAESLYEQKDYFNAITEFERYLFFNPSASQQRKIKYKLAYSYFYCNETLKSENILQALLSEQDSLSPKAQQLLAQIYLDTKRYFRAKIELNDLLFTADYHNKTKIYRALGYIALLEHDPQTALEYFTLAQDSWLITKTRHILRLPHKNVSLAQMLSTFIPGSGEIYARRYGWGILSFLINSAAIYGTIHSIKNKQYLDAALIFTIFFTRFYNGSRNNARDFAISYNQKNYQTAMKEIQRYYEQNATCFSIGK